MLLWSNLVWELIGYSITSAFFGPLFLPKNIERLALDRGLFVPAKLILNENYLSTNSLCDQSLNDSSGLKCLLLRQSSTTKIQPMQILIMLPTPTAHAHRESLWSQVDPPKLQTSQLLGLSLSPWGPSADSEIRILHWQPSPQSKWLLRYSTPSKSYWWLEMESFQEWEKGIVRTAHKIWGRNIKDFLVDMVSSFLKGML